MLHELRNKLRSNKQGVINASIDIALAFAMGTILLSVQENTSLTFGHTLLLVLPLAILVFWLKIKVLHRWIKC